MKISIQTKVLRLLFSFAFVMLLFLGVGSVYFMRQGADFATHYADEISNAAIDNSSEIIVSMRRRELLLAVKKNAGEVADFADEVRRDTRLLQTEMERIWKDPGGYRRTPIPAATEEQVWDGKTPLEELDQTVYAFITYAPGVPRAALQDEIAVTSNIRDFFVSFAEQAQQRKAHQTPVLGTKSGFLVKGDIAASPLDLEFRDSIWYRTAIEKGELTFTPLYLAQGAQNPVVPAVACTAPYRRNGEVLGVIGFGLRLDELGNLMKHSLDIISEANPGGLNFLLDEQGRVIFCQRNQREVGSTGEDTNDEFLDELFANIEPLGSLPRFEAPDVAAAVEDMKKGGTQILDFEWQGQRYTLAYAPVEGMEWSVGAVIPMPNVNADAEKNRRQIQTLTDSSMKELSVDMKQGSLYIMILTLLLVFLGLYSGKKLSRRMVNPLLKLRDGLKDIAKGDLDRKIVLHTGDEIEEVADAVNAMTVDIKNYIENISKITAEKERISMELHVAKDIQIGALPHDFKFPYKEFELFAAMDTAREVGGDFYDFYMLDEKHLAITIADVSGKGVPAALFMMRSRTILKNIAMMSASHDNYAAVVSLANQQLCEDNDESMFVTVFFGVLDLTTGELAYVNGGHNPPLVCRNGKFDYLRMEKKSVMLGVLDSGTYHEYRLTLAPGDMIFLYTDGVTEAMNEAGELYSKERLQRTLNEQCGKNVKDILTAVRENVGIYAGNAEQSDDITMLGLKFNGKFGET